MSENASAKPGERDLFELGVKLLGGVTRLTLTVVAVPLILLPKPARVRVRRGLVELTRGFVALPKEVSEISSRVIDEVLNAGPPSLPSLPSLPTIQELKDRARSFTDRVARAADEFGTGLERAAVRGASDVERTTVKVDEWVDRAVKS